MDNATQTRLSEIQAEINKNFELINLEVEKTDAEADLGLIQKYSDAVAALIEEEDRLKAAAEGREYVPNIPRLYENTKSKTESKCLKFPKIVKIATIAAAIAVFMVGGLTVGAKVAGYDSAYELIAAIAEKVMKMKLGDTSTEDNITVIKGDGVLEYSTIEEAWIKENLDFLCPEDLPNHLRINEVVLHEEANDKLQCIIKLASNDALCITNYLDVDLTLGLHLETKSSISGLTFYIFSGSTSEYQAICHHDGKEYTINCNDRDHLNIIIESMKGLSK